MSVTFGCGSIPDSISINVNNGNGAWLLGLIGKDTEYLVGDLTVDELAQLCYELRDALVSGSYPQDYMPQYLLISYLGRFNRLLGWAMVWGGDIAYG